MCYIHMNALEPTLTYLCYDMWDSHCGIDDESSLLGHGAMSVGYESPTFQRSLLPFYSGCKQPKEKHR